MEKDSSALSPMCLGLLLPFRLRSEPTTYHRFSRRGFTDG
jgi:hypothetical protein